MIDRNMFVLALLKMQGIGSKKAYSYIKSHGYNFEICYKHVSEIATNCDFEKCIQMASAEIDSNADMGIKAISLFDEKFPKKLLIKNDPVVFLYYLGDIELLPKKSIAIIGSRKASEQSLSKAFDLSAWFAERGFNVVSGLALGVDTKAHEGCLSVGGKTISVLPSALNNVTPSSNTELARSIIKLGGCLISEYSIGTTVSKFNYPKRDRIQAALADAVLVIEADENSGTMFAVKCAQENGRDVYQLKENNNSKIKLNVDGENDLIDIVNSIESFDVEPEHTQISLFD